jgi:hypothetical protein
MYEIHNAHSKGVTAIAITTCGHRIVSGGGEGQVSEPNSHWFMKLLHATDSRIL